jgi:peptide/nickel transport system substrate-binding protein
MKTRSTISAVAATALAVTLAGCAGSTAQGGATVKNDATFTLAINSDPGNLDPQAVFTAANRQMAYFLYDSLVNQQGTKIVSGLASSWTESGTNVTFALHRGATCSDGSPLTAHDVAANITYVANAKNKSALLGIAVPAGTSATADDAAGQVTVRTAKPTGFLLQSLSFLPIVCAKARVDRGMLAHGADGTGPYTLNEAVPGDHYTLQRRAGYTWGPARATTATAGLPSKVVVKVVSNETTAANLLVTGGLNAATVSGPDRSRLQAANMFSRPLGVIWGEFLYNQAPGRVGNSEAIRRGLTQALDLNQLLKVSTAGAGSAPKQLLGESPCQQDSVSGSLAAQDTSAAKSALQALSGKTLTLLYLSKLGPDVAAAAELAAAEWKVAGVTAQARGMSDTDLVNAVYKTGNWDIAWLPADGQLPSQIQSTFSGPTPAQGGNNFADIHNSTYDRLSATATQQLGDTGCPTWTKADQALMQHSDVVPFSVANYPVWGAHASFDTIFGDVVATSVRVLQ